ncbi:ab hydrolase superfamily [Fusarium albosuccineum]|uniref:Ab hydrolase superfamily n=1 Tax=Fusarium albosuccineum TaxID=1237068 RepID=A0A8H4L5B3_9HYPO|nr:ab hydrolase superfamily [Fusarium albosuccineum]
MAVWEDLPSEVRLQILDILCLESRRDEAARKPSILYVSVCREWQTVLEKTNFERIVLSQHRVRDFDRIVRGPRRKMVNHIWLRVELEQYHFPGEVHGDVPDRLLFFMSLDPLFKSLNTWETPRDVNSRGLTLELCAYALTDSSLMYQHHEFAHDPYKEPCHEFKYLWTDCPDPLRPWPRGRHTLPFSSDPRELYSSIQQILADGLYIGPPKYSSLALLDAMYRLPEVQVVTTLLIRRQYCRQIRADGMRQLLSSLSGLERLIHEPWELPGKWLQSINDQCYQHMIEGSFTARLKQLTIFEDHVPQLRRATALGLGHASSIRTHSLTLAVALTKATQHLEQASISFMIDAGAFFEPFWPGKLITDPNLWVWANLQSLALTSQILSPNQPVERISDLLEAAGTAAERMPSLRLMEIWNGDYDDQGCIFRYHIVDCLASITWHSTWFFEIRPEAIYCWSQAARQNISRELVVLHELMVTDGTAFPASVLRHLKSRELVLHPVSYRQFEIEGDPTKGANTCCDEWRALERTLPPPAGPELTLADLKRLANEEREALSKRSMGSLAHRIETIDYAIPSRDGNTIEARSYRPIGAPRDPPLPLYIHLQGGGFMFGTWTRRTRYWNDAEDAFEWAHDNTGKLCCDANKVILGGISGGAWVASSLVLQRHLSRGTNNRPPIAGQVLMIPCLAHVDCYEPQLRKMKHHSVSSYKENKSAPMLSVSELRWFTSQLKIDNPDAKDTKLNPGNATPEQVQGMPPTVLGIVGLDPLRDEALLYAKMLTEAGVPTDVNLFVGLPHGFRSYEEKLSASARWDRVIEDGICWALSGPSPSNEFHVKT